MAKVRYDYDGVEEQERDFEPYDGEEPRPGIYPGKVIKVTEAKSSNDNPMLNALCTITEGPYKGWINTIYLVQTPESIWKTKEFTDALGLTKPGKKKGVWDTDDAAGKPCRLRIKNEMYEGERRGKIRNVLGPKDAKADEEEPDADEPAEDTEPDEDTDPVVSSSKAPGEATSDDEADDEADEDDDEEGDDEEEDDGKDARVTELAGMDRSALKRVLKALKPNFKVKTSHTDDALRAEIIKVEFGEEPPF